MGFKGRLREARNRKGLTQEELGKAIGVQKATISSYETGNSEPDMNKISQIINILEIDANYLWQDEISNSKDNKENDTKKATLLGSTTNRQKETVDKYIKLDKDEQMFIDTSVDFIYKQQVNAQNDSIEWVAVNMSNQACAAGDGILLRHDDFSIVYVDKSKIPSKDVFLVPVLGDSMFPMLRNGDIAIVARNQSVNVGEIGLFTMNGKGFVKQRGKDKLISLNKKFPDIPYYELEEVKANGKIVGSIKYSDIREEV